jgi:hypothetical protein
MLRFGFKCRLAFMDERAFHDHLEAVRTVLATWNHQP